MDQHIHVATSEQDFKIFAELINEYVGWLRTRYQQDNWFITEVLDKQSLTSELETLSTSYRAPKGQAFIALNGDEVYGCGAYRTLDDRTCEIKRMFVPSRFQGSGFGRKLCTAIIGSARDEGYKLIKLDTGKIMVEAISMYKSFGFRECAPYYEYPSNLMPYFVFMEMTLVDQVTG
jgi:ribosomal protein S18 acetylase RimI-like enzyme